MKEHGATFWKALIEKQSQSSSLTRLLQIRGKVNKMLRAKKEGRRI